MSMMTSCLFWVLDVCRSNLCKANLGGFGYKQKLWFGNSSHYFNHLICVWRSLSALCKITMVIWLRFWKIWQIHSTFFSKTAYSQGKGRWWLSSIHGFWGQGGGGGEWPTDGLKAEVLQEFATNFPVALQCPAQHFTAVPEGPVTNHRHLTEWLAPNLPRAPEWKGNFCTGGNFMTIFCKTFLGKDHERVQEKFLRA